MTDYHDRRRQPSDEPLSPRALEQLQQLIAAGVEERMRPVQDRLEQGDRRMQRIEDGMAQTAANTADLLEAFAIAKGGLKFMGHVGAVVKWVAAVFGPIAAFWAWFKSHKG